MLTYYYSKNNGGKCFPGMWRSSQTKSGLTGQNRSNGDEKNLKMISQLSDKLVIYDARPYLNALAKVITGQAILHPMMPNPPRFAIGVAG